MAYLLTNSFYLQNLKVTNAFILTYFLFVACYILSFSDAPYSSKDFFDECDLPKFILICPASRFKRNLSLYELQMMMVNFDVFFTCFSASMGFCMYVPLKYDGRRVQILIILKELLCNMNPLMEISIFLGHHSTYPVTHHLQQSNIWNFCI